MSMTNNERMARYRWQGRMVKTLQKVSRLIAEQPITQKLPPLPQALVKAYGLDQQLYTNPFSPKD